MQKTQSGSSDLVRLMGLEPIRLLTHAPQTCLSAYSSTTAYLIFLMLCLTTDNNIADILYSVKPFFKVFKKISESYIR